MKWNCRFFEFFLSILNTKPWNIDHKKGSSWLETSIFSFNAIHYSAVYPTFLLFSFLDHFRTSKDWGKEEIKSHTWGAAQNSTWKIEEKQTVVSVTKLFHVCVFMYIFFLFSAEATLERFKRNEALVKQELASFRSKMCKDEAEAKRMFGDAVKLFDLFDLFFSIFSIYVCFCVFCWLFLLSLFICNP